MQKFLFGCCLFIFIPVVVEANHNSGRIDRDDLDDDIVETIPLPILFGIDLDDVVSDYGAPRGGGTRSHEGQDFLAPQGVPIVSPTEAIVISVGTWSGAGKYVQTANPGGETFRYMHLDEWADIDPGDKLDTGDYIGTVGDTGNAAPGAYHLHFEMLDEDGDPQDPYPRLGEAFDLEDKMDYLDDVFRDRRDDEDYAEFLIETFPTEFRQAYAEDIDLPRAIERVIDDEDWEDEVGQLQALTGLIESIPTLLTTELTVGDSGSRVILLQLYLIYSAEGAARNRLAAAGPTGYYGSITATAVSELQDNEGVGMSGVYDGRTRSVFASRTLETLTLDSQLAK